MAWLPAATAVKYLNLLRQVTKANGIQLVSNRKSGGYNPDGRKRFTYWYTLVALDGGDDIIRDSSGASPSAPISTPAEPAEPPSSEIVDGTIILPPS